MRCHNLQVVVDVSDLNPGVLNPDQKVCLNEKPQDLLVVDSASGGSGEYFYSWEYYDAVDSLWHPYLDTPEFCYRSNFSLRSIRRIYD